MFKAAKDGPQKSSPPTASATGCVVFQTPDGGWSLDIDTPKSLEDGGSVAAALDARQCATRARRIVVEPYPIDVTVTAAAVPVRLREKIRADGPTIGNSKA